MLTPKKESKFCHLHLHDSHCLSGDTLIYNCQKHYGYGKVYRNDYTRISSCKTIKYLYNCSIGIGKGRTYKKYKIKVWDGEKFVASKIRKIIKSKTKKKLFKITTENKEIKATKLHKFLTPDGWKRLQDLNINDFILCNGENKHDNYDWMKRKYIDENLNQQQIADLLGIKRGVIKSRIKKFNLHKTKSQWMKGHYVNPQTIQKIIKLKEKNRELLPDPKTESSARNRAVRWYNIERKCAVCGITEKIDIHHIDGNPFNFKRDNLIPLCKIHHKHLHAKFPYTARKERIKKIEYICEDYTYDIEVEHECHNFVANGFIVHNSQLDGLASSEEYVEMAKKLNMDYISITNHGNINSCIYLQKECEENNIKPVFGCELYITQNNQIKEKESETRHMTVWVKNKVGWKNLLSILSHAHLYGFYKKPRTDFTYFYEHCEGLIVGTACAGSFLTMKGGTEFFHDLHKKMGEDLYLEIMPHLIDDQIELNKKCYELHKQTGVKLIATIDAHYCEYDDKETHDVLLCIQTKKKIKDPERWSFDGDSYYFMNESEVLEAFAEQNIISEDKVLEAMANTIEIAKKCNYRIESKHISLPEVPQYKGMDEEQVIIDICERNFEKIFGQKINLSN